VSYCVGHGTQLVLTEFRLRRQQTEWHATGPITKKNLPPLPDTSGISVLEVCTDLQTCGCVPAFVCLHLPGSLIPCCCVCSCQPRPPCLGESLFVTPKAVDVGS
jgi:hypothetical protein